MTQQPLPLKKQIAYACGMMGWSMMINLISVILVYFYLPPNTSGLPKLIMQGAVFGIFNVIALVTAGGRFVDAVYDPMIAQLSDRSKNPKGRRIPFMKWAIVPSFVFCVLVFYPLKQQESGLNIAWLALMLVGFYVSTTTYIIPYNALLPGLAPSSRDKVRLSTWQSAGYVLGIGIASNAFNLAELFHHHSLPRIATLQLTVLVLAALAAVSMLIPVLAIDEKKYSSGKPSAAPLKTALRQALRNRNFLLFIVADFSYFMAITLITSGLMYFITVLLQLQETIGNKLMMLMVLVSFVFYPVTNYLAHRVGKKRIVIFSFVWLAITFLGVYFLGKSDVNHVLQIVLLIGLAAVPLASLNILPNAILAEIIEEDSKATGHNKEAIYFAVRYFFVKIAQSLGMGLFAMSLLYGKDVGNDFGVRLNGLLGFFLCTAAALIFTRFKEPRVNHDGNKESAES